MDRLTSIVVSGRNLHIVVGCGARPIPQSRILPHEKLSFAGLSSCLWPFRYCNGPLSLSTHKHV